MNSSGFDNQGQKGFFPIDFFWTGKSSGWLATLNVVFNCSLTRIPFYVTFCFEALAHSSYTDV